MSAPQTGAEEGIEDLQDLYENAPCGYLSLGPEGRIVKSNLTLSGWIGIPRETLVGKRLRDMLTVASSIFYETHFAPLLRMQGFFNEVALDLVTVSGKRLLVLANAVERRGEQGQLLFTRLTIFNATERRRYERELVEARAAAERGLELERTTAELREQFIAVLGHDLRNPLAGIQAGLRRIQRPEAAESMPAMVALMTQSAERMNHLINDVLGLAHSRLGAGLPLQIEAGVPLEPALQLVVDELRVAHAPCVILAEFVFDEPVDCDHGRMSQLLSNLLGNALTHGAAGSPVQVTAVARDGEFVLSVANAGKPIPQATMARLFHPFCRGEVQSNLQGLGLGLYISSQIAQAHGGTLTASSDEKLTVFTLQMASKRQ